MKALAGYNRTARPFNWKFSADDLTALLRRTSQREQVPASQQADSPQDTEDMDSERAETYLRLLAEAELRRAMAMPAGGSPGRWHSARLVLAAQALSAAGAVGTTWIELSAVGRSAQVRATLPLSSQ